MNDIVKQAPKFKICGMRYLPNVKELLAFKPDYLGFIFFVGSKRFTAAHEMDRIVKLDFGNTKRVGVFVNEDIETVLEFRDRGYFEVVQLHGDETPEYAGRLKKEGLEVIKAINVDDQLNGETLNAYHGHLDYLLFDTKGKYRGGNGWKFDWNILKRINHKTPFILSGGLTPADIEKTLSLNIPEMKVLDFNSQLEVKPGIKNVSLVEELVQTLAEINKKTA